MIKFIKRLFCSHEYGDKESRRKWLTDFSPYPSEITDFVRCKKCGKILVLNVKPYK